MFKFFTFAMLAFISYAMTTAVAYTGQEIATDFGNVLPLSVTVTFLAGIALFNPAARGWLAYRFGWTTLTVIFAGAIPYITMHPSMEEYRLLFWAAAPAVWMLSMPYCMIVSSARVGMRPLLSPALKVLAGMVFGAPYLLAGVLSEGVRTPVRSFLKRSYAWTIRRVDGMNHAAAYVVHTFIWLAQSLAYVAVWATKVLGERIAAIRAASKRLAQAIERANQESSSLTYSTNQS